MSVLIQSLWQHPIVELLGWTLVHFLWQGFLVAVPLAGGLWYLRRSSAMDRYSLACGGLALLAIMPILTLSVLLSRTDSQSWRGITAEQSLADATREEALRRAGSGDATSTMAPLDSSQDATLADRSSKKIGPKVDRQDLGSATTWWSGDHYERWMPTLASCWIFGVTLLSLRLLGGLWRVQQIQRRSRIVVDERLNRMVDELMRRMKVRGSLRLLQSAEWSVPVVIGFWRPTLIVPLCLLSGLTVSEVESLLAHELAHVRRHDWLVNLGQSLIETLLFYHPVVWWVSAVIRNERENCCDDVAVKVCGDRLALAKALVHLEEQRCGAGALALSATGGSLVQRIRRLAVSQEYCPMAQWSAGLLTLATAFLLVVGLWISVFTTTRSVQAAEEITNMEAAASLEQETIVTAQVREKEWLKPAVDAEPIEAAASLLGPVNTEVQSLPHETNTNGDETPWGRMAEASGLQSRLTLQTAKPQVGQPLLVKLELRNSGDKPAEYDPQKYAPFRVLRVDVPRPDLPPPFIGMRPQTSGQNETLQPGEHRTLWENVDVAELFLLAQDREYEVYAEGGEWAMQSIWRDSNHLSIRLQNGPLPARQKLIAALLEILPDEWTISVGFGEIHLRHSSTNLKNDGTRLSLRYVPEKLADDFSIAWPVPEQDRVFVNATVLALGETELGHIYLLGLPIQTEKVWPGYVGAITRAIERTRETPQPNEPDQVRSPDE